MGEKETAGTAGSALRPGDPVPDIDVSAEGSAESRYGGAQFAGGGMSALRGAGDGGPDPEAQAAKGVAQVGLGVAGQRAASPGGTADPSPAEARKSEHIYQHNESDLQ